MDSSVFDVFLSSSLQIVFDECHKAKNLCPVGSSKPTKTGLAVLELQNKLPKARVVYASATGEYPLGQKDAQIAFAAIICRDFSRCFGTTEHGLYEPSWNLG